MGGIINQEFVVCEVNGKRALVQVPVISRSMPAPLADALRKRRDANMTGECDCGAGFDTPAVPGQAKDITIRHAADCSASDTLLYAIIREHGYYPSGVSRLPNGNLIRV